MKVTKNQLIKFSEENVLIPAEDNTNADLKIKRKIKLTRMI